MENLDWKLDTFHPLNLESEHIETHQKQDHDDGDPNVGDHGGDHVHDHCDYDLYHELVDVLHQGSIS